MKKSLVYLLPCFLIVVFILTLSFNFSCRQTQKEEAFKVEKWSRLPDIKERLAKYAPTEITYNESLLNDEQKKVLEKLVEAAKYMDRIFWKQAYREGLMIKEQLEKSKNPADKDYLHFLKINFGPFDRQDGHRPFLGTKEKPLGAGFYPEDLTKQEFNQYLAAHPELRKEFENPYTVIKRKNGELTAVPYNEEYREELEPAARLLREASEITYNPSLKKYLAQRAEDLLTNNYYQSDCDWIDLKDNLVEIVIGPYEVYEDRLNGIKAAYESFVYINDREEMENIKEYLKYIDEMQKNLPVEEKYKAQVVTGLKSPLNAVYEVFIAGDTKAGIQTSAFVLPNDERVREEKGTKKVFLKNVMEAKFNKSLVPISQRVIEKSQFNKISFFAYFNHTILHEISHVLGVNYVTLPNGTQTTVNKALKERYSPIEEAKADVVGLYNCRLLIAKDWIPSEKEKEIYTTYLAGIFRALRFGKEEAHGLATLIQYNYLMEKGAFNYNPSTGRFKINYNKIKEAVSDLTRALLIIEGDGDYQKASEFITRYGQVGDLVKTTLTKLKDIPVDIEPVFQF
ncbi:MAG: peptidase [Candidatus Aminicenantia bacterium]